jgi:hypothetical protein
MGVKKFENFNNTREIVIADVKPLGNLDTTLQKFIDKVETLEKEGYSKEVGRVLKLLVEFGFTDLDWFDDLEPGESKEEVESIVIIGRSLAIRLNNIAQKYINNIEMPSVAEQIMDDKEFMSYFPNTTFI